MILLVLMCLAVALYYVGGEKWANTLFRDLGVPSCVILGLGLGIGWHLSLILVFLLMWGALCLGDYGKWQWSIHAFCVVLSTFPYVHLMNIWLGFSICLVVIPLLTYVTSRYLSFWDIIARGFLFGGIPIFFNFFNGGPR